MFQLINEEYERNDGNRMAIHCSSFDKYMHE